MSNLKRRYFVVEAADVGAVRALVLEQEIAYLARREDFTNKHGTTHLMLGRDQRIMEILLPKDAAAPTGTRKVEDRSIDGKVWVHYKPLLNRKAGIALHDEMAAVGGFSASEIILGHYGCKRMVLGDAHAMWVSTAGLVKNQIVIQVPENSEQVFTPPEGFKELKKSEWIALTEE